MKLIVGNLSFQLSQEKNTSTTPLLDVSYPKIYPATLNRINGISHVNPRSVSSFKEQLDVSSFILHNASFFDNIFFGIVCSNNLFLLVTVLQTKKWR